MEFTSLLQRNPEPTLGSDLGVKDPDSILCLSTFPWFPLRNLQLFTPLLQGHMPHDPEPQIALNLVYILGD